MSDVVSLADAVDAARERAVTALRDGGAVVVPAEGVYAVVADAFSQTAIQRVFAARRRARTVPLPVLIASERQVAGLAAEVPEFADRLMAAYWPGPLTLILPASEGLGWEIGEGQGTVQIRRPADDFLVSLISEIGPLVCAAANRQGRDRPTTVADAKAQLGVMVQVYVDGGERDGHVSTVVDCTRGAAEVRREGAIGSDDIIQVASGALPWGQRPSDELPAEPAAATEAPVVEAEPVSGAGPVVADPSRLRVAIGADHAGYALKQHLTAWLRERGHEVTDHGTDSTASVDYPPIMAAVARAVTGGAADRGIVLGGSGQGEQISANKVRGARAALCNDLYTARMSRLHNDANVLAIGARIVAPALAEEILGVWLETAFEGGRHQRRIEQIAAIEDGA